MNKMRDRINGREYVHIGRVWFFEELALPTAEAQVLERRYSDGLIVTEEAYMDEMFEDYAAYCVAVHGDYVEGIVGPQFASKVEAYRRERANA